MLDRFKAFWQGKALAPFINLFIRLGISPDVVTLVGTLGVVAGALVFFPQGWLLAGRAGDHGVRLQRPDRRRDGPQDRAAPTTFGAFLDSTLDRIADAALFGGLALFFAWQADDRLYLVLCLVCLVMGAVTSYARAKGRAARLQRQGRASPSGRPAGRDPGDDRRSSATCSTCRSCYEVALWAARGREHDHGRPADPAGTPPGARARPASRIGSDTAPRPYARSMAEQHPDEHPPRHPSPAPPA